MIMYYSSITLIVSITLISMLTMVFCNKSLSKSKRYGFIFIYTLILIASVCEWAGNILDGTSGMFIIILHKFVKFIELSITPTIPFLCARYIFNVQNKSNKSLLNVMLAFILFHIFLQCLSIHFGFIFYIDSEGYCRDGSCYIIYIIAILVSSTYFFVNSFLFCEYYQNENRIVLIMIMGLLIVGASFQLIYNYIKTDWLTLSIASILIYIYYNNLTMYIDHLTKLLNQRSYKNFLENISSPAAVQLFDVDNFKQINDNYGHDFGDKILTIIGDLIKEVYGDYGYCYRIGGDEFCVILTKFDKVSDLNREFVSKINTYRQQTEPHIPYVSIGCAYFDPEYTDISDVVKLADEDMYKWKKRLKSIRSNKS